MAVPSRRRAAPCPLAEAIAIGGGKNLPVGRQAGAVRLGRRAPWACGRSRRNHGYGTAIGVWPATCFFTGMIAALPPALTAFLDPAALAIVVGGTLAAVALRTPAGLLMRSVGAVRLIGRRGYSADAHLQQIAAFGRIARRNGTIALDRSVIADPDLAAAIEAIVDCADPDAVARIVTERRDARVERHLAVADTWAATAEMAPTMGMVGTLIGLAQMFRSMTDPAAIGPAMAIALLATLYGALLATLIANPVAARLRRLARIEAFERARLEAPLVALAERERPRLRELAA